MKRIFLTGYMASGKSTLGRAFSLASGLGFVDLDGYIEERMHHTVGELFAMYGEEGFREIERKMLHEAAYFEDVVISCGGGTPCFFDNMDFMNACGITVFLDVNVPRLHERLKKGRAGRPLLSGKTDEELMDFIVKGLEKRLPFYSRSRIRIDGSRLEDRKQIKDTVELLQREIGLLEME